MLFRIELLRTWYGLSDYEVENQVNDRLSFSTFVGISMDDSCPDSTTICRFRNSLVAGGVYDELLAEINRQLETKGDIVKTGAIVDASVTDSPRRPRGKKSYIIVEDRGRGRASCRGRDFICQGGREAQCGRGHGGGQGP